MKNASILRNELSKVFKQIKNNEIDIQQAKVLVATSNSMLKSAQLQMEQSKMIGSGKSVEFLNL